MRLAILETLVVTSGVAAVKHNFHMVPTSFYLSNDKTQKMSYIACYLYFFDKTHNSPAYSNSRRNILSISWAAGSLSYLKFQLISYYVSFILEKIL
nr:hypothetical protein Itr_chr02CG02680 [Ipomoea trifida]